MNTLHVATWLAIASAVVSFAVGVYTAWWYASKARVLVHRAFFMGPGQASPSRSGAAYFIKVTNLSRHRDIEITHVWFASNPPVYVMLAERPLPTRLRPDETWEGWADAAALADASNVEGLGRVRLSSGKTIKSRLNENVPPVGYVAGPGSPEDQIADLRARLARLEERGQEAPE